MTYIAWNTLFSDLRAYFGSLEEAQSWTTARGGPNRITSLKGEEWISGAYPNRMPQWFGPYKVDELPHESNRPGD